MTRSDIMAAAQDLFASRGYARVTVADIAHQAGIAVKTVYASAGGKAEILAELLADAVADSGAEETLALVRQTADLAAAMTVLAHGTRLGNEANRDSIDILYSAVPAHEGAENAWEQGTSLYRRVLRDVAVHLARVGALAVDGVVDSVDKIDEAQVDRTADILWFCFGIGAWRTLVKDCGWAWDDAENWLRDQAVAMLGGATRS